MILLSTLEVQEYCSVFVLIFSSVNIWWEEKRNYFKLLFEHTHIYINWPCSVLSFLFFPLHHHSSCLPVETITERRGRSETIYSKTNLFFSFFSYSLCLNDIRSNTFNTYIIRSLSRWPQNKNANTIICVILSKEKNKSRLILLFFHFIVRFHVYTIIVHLSDSIRSVFVSKDDIDKTHDKHPVIDYAYLR